MYFAKRVELAVQINQCFLLDLLCFKTLHDLGEWTHFHNTPAAGKLACQPFIDSQLEPNALVTRPLTINQRLILLRNILLRRMNATMAIESADPNTRTL